MTSRRTAAVADRRSEMRAILDAEIAAAPVIVIGGADERRRENRKRAWEMLIPRFVWRGGITDARHAP